MEDLIESILDYVRAEYTDYAIMLNGEWGSGKTYFWNNRVKKRIESLTLGGKKFKTIYMSLYGISNLDEISKKIFLDTTQMMDKDLKKYMEENEIEKIPEYAKTGMNIANRFGIVQDGEKLDYSKFFETDNKVLVFDDLERANVDVIDILGYINNFVEHDHIKTIIICNEKELATKIKNENLELKTFIATYILDKQSELLETDLPLVEKIKEKIDIVFEKSNDYERIKEKLVGETFEYAPQFNYIIDGILMRYEENKDLIRFLRENTSLITRTFLRSGTRNLRILKHSLNDFERIFKEVSRSYPNTNNRILQTMLIFTIAVSFEIKAGKITRYKFETIEDNESYKSILVSSRVLSDSKQFYIKEFDNNYYYNFKSDYRFFKFIELYVRTRIFDMKQFKKDMEVIIHTVDTSKLPAYKRLLTEEYWKISDEEFPKIIKEAYLDVKNGKLTLLETLKLFPYFSYFIKKELIDHDIDDLKQDFINGMNKASIKTEEYTDNIDEELSKTGMEISSDMDDIIEHFEHLNEEIKRRIKEERADEIFKNIPIKMETFYDAFNKECMNEPIFKYYDSFKMFQRITNATNEDIVTISEILYTRAKDKKEEFAEELSFMMSLKRHLENYLENRKPQIKTVMLKSFVDTIDEIILLYSSEKLEKEIK